MAFTNNYNFDSLAAAEANWIFSDPIGTGLQTQNSGRRICWHNAQTASGTNTVGPTQGQGGVGDGYVYTEASSPAAAGDQFFAEIDTNFDASTQDITFSFYRNQNGANNECTFQIQSNENGAGWINRGSVFGGVGQQTDSVTWIQHTVDMTGLISNASTRFRIVITLGSTGNIWNNDGAIDSVQVVGVDQVSSGIVFIDSSTVDQAAAQALTLTIPGTAQANDFMIAFVKQSENTGGQVWDDDGGGGNGWIQLAYNRTTGGRDQETAIYWKIHDGSESNPTFTWNVGGVNEPMSGSLLVYRGTDLINPIQDWGFTQAQNDANPPNPQVTNSSIPATIIVFHAATHDDISAVGAPTGYNLRTQVWSGTANDHRNHFTADLIGDNSLGAYTPPDWQHSVLNTTPEYHTYTVSLQEPISIQIDDFNVDEKFNWGDVDLTITGFGFEASQGIGKVEFWDDVLGTTKTIQTVDSWNDLSIQIDTIQGSLPNNTSIYLVVTNNSGLQSSPLLIVVGLIQYHQLIVETLKADHYWRLNNTYDDTGDTGPTRPMTSSIVGTWTFNNNKLSDSNTHSLNMDGVSKRREIADSANMNITISSQERTIGAWFQINNVQQPLAAIWKEGGGVQNLAFLIGMGNVLLAQLADVATTRDNVQAWSDIKLTPNRPYHICMRYSHLDPIKEMRLFLDGVEQINTDGNPMTLGVFDSHSGDVVWNDPDTNLETGGTDISYNGLENAQLSDFATWSDNSNGTNAGGLDKTSEIRDILFRRGSIPKYTVSSDTESNMQSNLDAQLTDNEVEDWPLGIRVEDVVGQNDLELVADNISFNSRTTDHLEWRGSGTLTWVLRNGASIDQSKIFSSGGGNVVVQEDVVVKITVRDIDTNIGIPNAVVLLEAGSGGNLTLGVDIIKGICNSSGEIETILRYSSDQPVTGRVRRASTGIRYIESPIASTITDKGLNITIFLIKDE